MMNFDVVVMAFLEQGPGSVKKRYRYLPTRDIILLIFRDGSVLIPSEYFKDK